MLTALLIIAGIALLLSIFRNQSFFDSFWDVVGTIGSVGCGCGCLVLILIAVGVLLLLI